jgi:hypothetical protein
MPLVLKPVAVHAIVGNAPKIISVAATASPASVRVFIGTGAPGNATLAVGNGKYNGLSSGYLIDASLFATGSGYVVGDVLTLNGGTVAGGGSAMQITVDMVNASGAIVDFHISLAGSYSTYPGASESTIGGTGSGAQFLVNTPPPDYYLDITTPTAPVLYVCQTSGSNGTSVWAKVSGSGSSASLQQYQIQSDNGDYWVCFTWDGTTPGTLNVNVIKPSKLRAGTNAITSETIRGVTYTYSYTYDSTNRYYTRSVSGSDGSSEMDYITPDAIPQQDTLFAAPCTTNIVNGIPQTIATAMMTAAGSGYAANQILTLQGGTIASGGSPPSGGSPASVKVLTVNGSGAILTYTLLTAGNYATLPSPMANVPVNTGSATFTLTAAPQLIDLNVDARAWAK